MPTKKLASGLTITTFEMPPQGFDPLLASESDLLRYGFPSREHAKRDPTHLARLEKVFKQLGPVGTGRLRMIEPVLEERTPQRFHGPRRRAAEDGTQTSGNWSGSVQFAPAGQSFRWIIGDFTVPSVFPKGVGSEFCSAWIGIDGDGSNDVCQFGIECDTTKAANGSVSNSYYAWLEWYPIAEVPIANFPIAPGDDLTLLLCTSGAGATSASLYFTNRTSGVSTSLQFSAPSGTALIGNSAEWIVETPTVGGALATMPEYGSVVFYNAYAVTGSTTLYAGGTGATNINLVRGGTTFSTGILVANEYVQCVSA